MALFKPMVGPNDNIGKTTKVAGQLLMTYDKGYLYIDTLNPNNNLVTRWTINPDLQDMSGTLTINKGGTGATTAEGARSNLGLGSAAIANILATTSDINSNTSSSGLVNAAQVVAYVTSLGYITTDTKNTAGASDTSSKIFLIGATSQSANPQTYSQDTAYVGTDGHLYSNDKQVVNLSDSQNLTNKTYNGLTLTVNTTGFSIKGGSTTAHTLTVQSDITLAAAAGKGVVTDIANNTTSSNLPTAAAVATYVKNSFSANDAMRFKGTVSSSTGNGTLKSWPPATYEVGDTYKVADAGTYSGQECEVGDMLICIQNYKEGSASNADWAVVQNNITVAINSGSKAGLAAYYDQTNSISAIDLTTLDVTENGTSITAITSVTQDSKGKITVNKATISGVKPAAHTHGNITDDGKIGSAADLAIVTTTKGTLTAVDLKVSTASSTSGTALSFVDNITQDSRGQINFTKKDIPTVIGATGTQAGTKGLVPAAAIGQQTYLLTGAGTWMKPYSNGTGLLLDRNNVFSLNTSGVTAGNYGPSKDITLSTTTDGKFNVPYITVDTYGRITAASTKTITMDAIVWGTF